jgi:hypothetical protein
MPSTTSRDAVLTSAYADLHLLVYSITHSFSLRFNIPFDDLISEAHIQFVKSVDKFDKKKGMKLSSWVYHEVWTGLMSFMRKELRHRGLDEFTELTPMPPTAQNNYLLELQSELSKDAKAVVKILLDGGRDFSTLLNFHGAETKTSTLEVLREHLADSGFSLTALTRGIADLRALVNGRSKTPNELVPEDDFYDDSGPRQYTSREECWLLNKVGLTPCRVQALLAS